MKALNLYIMIININVITLIAPSVNFQTHLF